VVKFVSDLRQVGGFLPVLWFVYVVKFVSDLRQVGGSFSPGTLVRLCGKVCQ
jgi:hypothetical protein